MALIEKPDFKAKKGVTTVMKMVLMIAVILGIWSRSCWRQSQVDNILFDNITIGNTTSASVEVLFTVSNHTFQSGNKNVFIKIYTDKDELLASRITAVDIGARESRRYVRTVERFNRPLREGENIHAQVSLYQRSLF